MNIPQVTQLDNYFNTLYLHFLNFSLHNHLILVLEGFVDGNLNIIFTQFYRILIYLIQKFKRSWKVLLVSVTQLEAAKSNFERNPFISLKIRLHTPDSCIL